MDPAERELLLGTEASGAAYLCESDLGQCDGFLIVGDAFAANPTCSRGVFDSRAVNPRVPIAVIDPGAGSAVKFASLPIATPPGTELAALAAAARGAGVDVPELHAPTGLDADAARAAGAALARARRPAVLLAAEYGRGGAWRQIGLLAGRIAAALGGGVSCQTNGANALAAVRLGPRLESISLAEALGHKDAEWAAIGCDVLGALGMADRPILAAAAALPNRSTRSARIVLPAALAAELGGTYLLGGEKPVRVDAAARPPAGAASPAAIIAAIARAAGANVPRAATEAGNLPRLAGPVPKLQDGPPLSPPKHFTVLLGRHAVDAGCGEITSHGAFQASAGAVPDVRMAAADARRLGLKDLDKVQVRSDGICLTARVQITPSLPAGVAVLPEAMFDARAMCPLRTDGATTVIMPATAKIEAANDYASTPT